MGARPIQGRCHASPGAMVRDTKRRAICGGARWATMGHGGFPIARAASPLFPPGGRLFHADSIALRDTLAYNSTT